MCCSWQSFTMQVKLGSRPGFPLCKFPSPNPLVIQTQTIRAEHARPPGSTKRPQSSSSRVDSRPSEGEARRSEAHARENTCADPIRAAESRSHGLHLAEFLLEPLQLVCRALARSCLRLPAFRHLVSGSANLRLLGPDFFLFYPFSFSGSGLASSFVFKVSRCRVCLLTR